MQLFLAHHFCDFFSLWLKTIFCCLSSDLSHSGLLCNPYVSSCQSKIWLYCSHFTYFLIIFLSLVQCLRSRKIPVIAPSSLRSYPQSRMLSSATMDATWWPETTCLSRSGIWTWRAGQWRPIRWDWQMHSSNVWCWLCCTTVNGLWGIYRWHWITKDLLRFREIVWHLEWQSLIMLPCLCCKSHVFEIY